MPDLLERGDKSMERKDAAPYEEAEEATEDSSGPNKHRESSASPTNADESMPKKPCLEPGASTRASSASRDVPVSAPAGYIQASPLQMFPISQGLQEVPSVSNASPGQHAAAFSILPLSAGMQNMILAHEIAVNADFTIPEPKEPPNDGSLAAKVHEMMHKAFWDHLTMELAEDPPRYTRAMDLFREVKEMLLDCVPVRAKSLRQDIEGKLDVELIKQQAEAGTIDFKEYAGYVINLMSKMCCPARDDDVKGLTTLTDVVPTFKGILEVLKKMKIDFANFSIREARPIVVANSIQYEKKKFEEYMKSLPPEVDGLVATRSWLTPHKSVVMAKVGDQVKDRRKLLQRIHAAAIVDILSWREQEAYPETLVLDRERLKQFGEKINEIIIAASVIMIALTEMRVAVPDQTGFKQLLKEHLMVLLQGEGGCTNEALAKKLPAVAIQVLKDINTTRQQLGQQPLSQDVSSQLTGQIEAVGQPTNSIRKVFTKRIMEFIQELLSTYDKHEVPLPSGVSVFVKELHYVIDQLREIACFNLVVYCEYYTDILCL